MKSQQPQVLVSNHDIALPQRFTAGHIYTKVPHRVKSTPDAAEVCNCAASTTMGAQQLCWHTPVTHCTAHEPTRQVLCSAVHPLCKCAHPVASEVWLASCTLLCATGRSKPLRTLQHAAPISYVCSSRAAAVERAAAGRGRCTAHCCYGMPPPGLLPTMAVACW